MLLNSLEQGIAHRKAQLNADSVILASKYRAMDRKIPLTVALLLAWSLGIFDTVGQVFPAEGDTLTQTSVCFTFPWKENAASYSVALVDEARPRQVMSYSGVGNKIIVNGLHWGHSYTWFVASLSDKGETMDVSNPTRFFVAPDKENVRFVFITNDSLRRGHGLLLLDYTHAALNRKGEKVWYLPGIAAQTNLRDLRLTDDGTVTAVIDSNAVEMDLRGNLLWKAPARGQRADYHHSFTKLHTGNYLVAGCDVRRYRIPGRSDSAWVDVGTVVEFTPAGKIAWQWNGRDFFKPEWIRFKPDNKGGYMGSVHLNAVSTDGEFVYAGFRDAGWVLKIRRANGKVEAIYGGSDSRMPTHYAQGMFRFQHDAFLMKDGSLAVVNNDSVEAPGVVSSVVVLSQAKTDVGTKVFEFPFNFDGKTHGKSLKLGSVTELPNGNLLVNMGAINRILEITRDKKVVWDVWVEKFDTFKKGWEFYPQYHVGVAGSLYPNEFCVKTYGRRDKKGWWGSVTLVNVGSETNTYSFWTEKKGKPVLLTKTPPVPSGGSHNQLLSVPGNHTVVTVRVEGKSKRETLALSEYYSGVF